MAARFLQTFPCQDACGTVETDERVEGAPVYRCPGCDSSWIELSERTEPTVDGSGQPPAP
jgi:predicted Zn-ribbon and HTH transcriptional regulator